MMARGLQIAGRREPLDIETLRQMHADPRPRALFMCRVCGALHDTSEAAGKCGDGFFQEPQYKVGDIVPMELGYGWHDGDPNWVLKTPGHNSHGTATMMFWFVITAITGKPNRGGVDQEAHTPAYHMATLAIHNGLKLFGGWNTPATHRRIGSWSVENLTEEPSEVVRKAAAALTARGHTFEGPLP